MESGPRLKTENPKYSANLLTKLFLAWTIKLYRTAIKRNLKIPDLPNVLNCDKSTILGDHLERNWNTELGRAKQNNRKPKLLKAIVKTFIWNYMFYGLLLFIQHVGLRSLQPVVLAHLISLFSVNSTGNSKEMYISAAILLSISIVIIFSMHHIMYGQASIGMRIRIAVSSLIYRKTLKLNKKSLNETATGKVVNMLSNDVTRFDLVIISLHYLWIMPFQASLVTYLIWREVGVSAFVGVFSVVFLSLPVQGSLGKLASTFRMRVAQKTDYRVTLMSEIIAGMQAIKMYAWEKPFEYLVKLARLEEVNALTLSSYLRGIYLSFMLFVERIALFFTITSFVLMGNQLLAEKVFSLAQFFNLLQLTMAIFYPMSISYGAEALVAIERLQSYLMMGEVPENPVQKDFSIGVSLRNVTAAWKPNELTLKNISAEIRPGSLCVIIGPVGAGKSSLLNLLLGELMPTSGQVTVQGEIAFASQEPWLFAASVRNNILFGQNYDRFLYNRVVKVCALEKDFEQLPSGDKTLVGERGAALSGGQKARVNLARAIYRQADVYLLDDPLSAVDAHVGKHLFDECIFRYLRNKTRILVTHQVQYLKKADHIILLNEGKIEAQGSYDALCELNLDFTEIISSNQDDTPQNEPQSPQTPIETRSPLMLSGSYMLESLDLRPEISNEEEVSLPGVSALKQYIKSSGNYCQIFLVILLLIASQVACSGCDYWVTFWTQQEVLRQVKPTAVLKNITETVEYYPEKNSGENSYSYTYVTTKNVTLNNHYNPVVGTYLAIYIYSGLTLGAVIITLIRSIFYFKLAMNASKNLHNKMFSTLLEVPMKFFNTNPTGRILNRFSKDIGAVDEILPKVLLESIQITFVMFGILVMVIISNYYMVAAVFVLGLIFMKLRAWFIKTSKNIKHLEGITKSPMFSHLNSSLYGMATIRAFNASEMLKNEFDSLQDINTSAWSMTIICMVSFGLWLDIICVIFIACTSFSFIILHQFGQVSGSLVGLAISQALTLTGMLQYGIRQTGEVINQLTSVERILHYTTIDKEGPFHTPKSKQPIEPWPSRGLIVIKNLSLQYSQNDPPVLKNLSVSIKPGQKIGIVGRTGAGKSSLIAALFRLTDIGGRILIDGVNTQNLGLYDLRKKISIIPQEPVLFSASLRYNLDPFSEYDDAKIWAVLEDVELKDAIRSLDDFVAGGGKNFSVGQRQLLCLARASLRDNKILILDEATANIDPRTDSLIQETIRRNFKKSTVLTVAHRLNTIMDSDRVIVMEAGEIAEFGYPYELLQRPDSIFYKMVLDTGASMSMRLEEIALQAYLNRKHQED